MVFFNCNACGEALKKNQVEKHYLTKCRSCEVLSCVDCGKDFWGNDYQEHTKCISEEEKYSGKDWKPKPNANKGEAKQEQWIQQVQMAIDKSGSNAKLKNMLQRLKDYPNIPRKKAKFENFLKNSLRIYDNKLESDVWQILEQQAQQSKQNSPSENTAADSKSQENTTNSVDKQDTEENNQMEENKKLSKRERKEERRKVKNKAEKKDKNKDQVEINQKKKKHKKNKSEDKEENDCYNHKKKRKRHDEDEESLPPKKLKTDDDLGSDGLNEEEEHEDESPAQKFSWEATIIGVLKKATDNEISVKKLKKKVLAEYNARGGDGKTKCEEKLFSKLNKKINKNPRLKVLKDRVKLIH